MPLFSLRVGWRIPLQGELRRRGLRQDRRETGESLTLAARRDQQPQGSPRSGPAQSEPGKGMRRPTRKENSHEARSADRRRLSPVPSKNPRYPKTQAFAS